MKREVSFRFNDSPPILLSLAWYIQFKQTFCISMRSVFILSSHLRLCLPSGQHHDPAALPPGKTRYPLGGWVGPRAGLDGCGKSRPPTGIRSPELQPVVSLYTYWAIPALVLWGMYQILCDKCETQNYSD